MRTPHNECVSSDIVEGETSGSNSGSAQTCSQRRCVLCGESFPRDELIRLAVSPDGEVLPDPQAKAPGRGAWIAPDKGVLENAVRDGHLKKALLRAFKGGPGKEDGNRAALSYSDDLPQQVANALKRTLLDRLGLELRGGNIVLGSAKIEEHARSGRIALLLHASDSSEDGRKKLDQAWRVGTDQEGTGVRGIVLPLDRDALSVALGRENVVHLGVSTLSGGRGKGSQSKKSVAKSAWDRVGRDVTRLSRFLGNDPPT